MGITISYRGTIASLDRVEDFEDRVLDLALELDGLAHIYRTEADKHSSRMVRGIVLDLCPGQETTGLLISPEGWLVGMPDVENAEKGKLAEMPWCRVKTQFGTLDGHVALVEMFAALKSEFFPDLEVVDEGGYWETRDVNGLAGKTAFVQAASEKFRAGMPPHDLPSEAAKDPEIAAARLARITQLVQTILMRPPQHPPVRWPDDGTALDSEGRVTREEEARWEADFKQKRRELERMNRDTQEPDEEEDGEETADELPAEVPDEDEDREDEQESPPEEVPDGFADDALAGEGVSEEESADGGESGEHPLQRRATALLRRMIKLVRSEAEHRGLEVLWEAAFEIESGLITLGGDFDKFPGQRIPDLKRALRGAAFALGASLTLRADGVIGARNLDELDATLRELQSDIANELRRRRSLSCRPETDWPRLLTSALDVYEESPGDNDASASAVVDASVQAPSSLRPAYLVDVPSLEEHFPPEFPLPKLLREFAAWLRDRQGSIGGLKLWAADRMGYCGGVIDLHRYLVPFIRTPDGSEVAFWFPEGKPTASPPVVLVGSEGELANLGDSLEEFLQRLGRGKTGNDDLDYRHPGETDEGPALLAWLKERGATPPHRDEPPPDFRKWFENLRKRQELDSR